MTSPVALSVRVTDVIGLLACRQDCYMDPFVLDVKPQWLALACIHVSLQCYGLSVPGSVEGGRTWYEVGAAGGVVTGSVEGGRTWYEAGAAGGVVTGSVEGGRTWYEVGAAGRTTARTCDLTD